MGVPAAELRELELQRLDRAQLAIWTAVTGGTEQNGPYVILGKHNDIARHTAGEIARRLGHTLVAPVIAYVPEGDPGAAPTGHMRFSGTLTVPETTPSPSVAVAGTSTVNTADSSSSTVITSVPSV